jgi:hypothetical protein
MWTLLYLFTWTLWLQFIIRWSLHPLSIPPWTILRTLVHRPNHLLPIPIWLDLGHLLGYLLWFPVMVELIDLLYLMDIFSAHNLRCAKWGLALLHESLLFLIRTILLSKCLSYHPLHTVHCLGWCTRHEFELLLRVLYLKVDVASWVWLLAGRRPNHNTYSRVIPWSTSRLHVNIKLMVYVVDILSYIVLVAVIWYRDLKYILGLEVVFSFYLLWT